MDCFLSLSSKDFLVSSAKEGEWELLASGLTDTPPLKRVEDIIREKLFLHLDKEIPYVIDQVRLGYSDHMYHFVLSSGVCNMLCSVYVSCVTATQLQME